MFNMFAGNKTAQGAAQQIMVDQMTGGATANNKGGNGTDAKAGKQFLFCIPLQVGPSTPYARSMGRWMMNILIVQFIITVIRFIALRQIVGGIWMLLTVCLGAMAWREDMNITYVCAWGLLCLANIVVDILTMVFSNVTRTSVSDPLEIVIHIFVGLSYLIGAAFARHLYNDYAAQEGLPMHDLGGIGDPFGAYVHRLDKESRRLQAQEQGYGGTDTGQPLDSTASQGPSATTGVKDPAAASTPSSMFTGGWQTMTNAMPGGLSSQAQPPAAGQPQAGGHSDVKVNPFLT